MILSAFLLSSCGTVKVRDEEFCADKGELGARCVYDLSGKKRNLDYRAWEDLRFGWVCTSPDSFGRRQAALLKFCEDTGRCKQEEIEEIENAGKRVQALFKP